MIYPNFFENVIEKIELKPKDKVASVEEQNLKIGRPFGNIIPIS